MKHVNFEKSKNVLEKANKSDLITIFTQKIRQNKKGKSMIWPHQFYTFASNCKRENITKFKEMAF